MDMQSHKEKKEKRSHFPESNRFLTRLQLFAKALVPMAAWTCRRAMRKVKSVLSEVGARITERRERRRVPALVFLAVAALLVIPSVFFSLFTWGTTVVYDGQELGIVTEEGAAAEAVSKVESGLADVLGDTFTLDQSLVSYSTGLVSRDSVVEADAIEENLSDELNLVTYAYSLYVEGECIGTTKSKEALEALLEQVKTPYINENTQSVEFVEKVEIREGYVPNESITNLGDIVLKINETKAGKVVYTVEKGDVWGRIAQDHGMTSAELAKLNPGFDIDKLQIGDELLISNAVPYLTIQVSQYEYYIADIPYDIEYVDDPNMWEGDTSVVSKGVYGKADTVALVTYVNSEEVSHEIMKQVALSEPVAEVQKRGTAERPSWAPTGSFRWPTSGSITSRYGYRNIFGGRSFHSGIDIANKKGTNIVAADGGIVTYAGWMSGYGYLVRIDHQNGYVTYYGHNSSMLVGVGQKVHKGQHIAEMGSTGRSTGNHCHFEIRYKGDTKNPMNYLP